MIPKQFEVRILFRQPAVLRIERDRAAKVLERGARLLAPRHRDRHHVVRVIVFGIFGERSLQVLDRGGLVAGVERNGCGVDTFFGGPRRGFARRQLAFADLQIEPGALEQLPLIRVPFDHHTQRVGGGTEVVALERLESPFVQRDRLVIRRLSGRRRRRRRGSGSGLDGGRSGDVGPHRPTRGYGLPPGRFTSGGAGAGGPVRLRHQSRARLGSVSRRDSNKSLVGGSSHRRRLSLLGRTTKFTRGLEPSIDFIRGQAKRPGDLAGSVARRQVVVFYQSTNFCLNGVVAYGGSLVNQWLARRDNHSELALRHGKTRKEFANWSNDQVLVCLCQLSSNSNRPIVNQMP